MRVPSPLLTESSSSFLRGSRGGVLGLSFKRLWAEWLRDDAGLVLDGGPETAFCDVCAASDSPSDSFFSFIFFSTSSSRFALSPLVPQSGASPFSPMMSFSAAVSAAMTSKPASLPLFRPTERLPLLLSLSSVFKGDW